MQLCLTCVHMALGAERLGVARLGESARTRAEREDLIAKLSLWVQRDGHTYEVHWGENPTREARLPMYAVTAVKGTPVCARHVIASD